MVAASAVAIGLAAGACELILSDVGAADLGTLQRQAALITVTSIADGRRER